MTKRLFRNIEVLLCFLTLLVFFASYYFLLTLKVELCPLNITQRIGIFFLLLVTSIGVRLGTIKRARLIVLCQAIIAVANMYFAGMQLWWQSLSTDGTGTCLPPLDILWKYLPWKDIFHAFIIGSCDCNKVNWEMLGISMPGWILFYSIFIFLVSTLIYWRLKTESINY